MKKSFFWALPVALLLCTACGSSKEEQRVEQGMEEEAPIVTESEQDPLLDFEETDEEYEAAKSADAAAAPVMQSVREDKELNATLEEAKSEAEEVE